MARASPPATPPTALWIPSLERAHAWNDWMEEELILHLAGHFNECALQEWSLLSPEVRKVYAQAKEAL